MRTPRQVAKGFVLSLGFYGAFTVATSGYTADLVDTSDLRAMVNVEGILQHLNVFQSIADVYGGNRASGTPGYDASVAYVFEQMVAAGYEVSVQPFDFPNFLVLSRFFAQTSPLERVFEPFDFLTEMGDYYVMTYSGSGVVTDTEVVPTNDVIIPAPAEANISTSGCEAEDFLDAEGNSLVAGKVALIQRGTCTFQLKVENAEAAGAAAALIFNEGQVDLERDGVVRGTLGEPMTIPVLGISYYLGVELYDAEAHRVSLDIQTLIEILSTVNVLAETPSGREDRVVVVGAHLDSVVTAPGINDNGSGAATILEIALQMAALDVEPSNKVRFAWWGAEEHGLLGSEYYVSSLSQQELKDLALNLNFDMVGSPNYVRFVYDGDGSDTEIAGPMGSANIEDVLLSYFASQGLETSPVDLGGGSDYASFAAVGIPVGGLSTGAGGVKTEEEALIYGGIAGEPYDPCYHFPCDTLENIDGGVLDQLGDAAAHAVLTFALTTSLINGTDKGSDGALKEASKMELWGPHLRQ